MVQKNSLTIQVLSIIGGILTAILFLGFLAVSSLIKSQDAALIIGIILIISTLTINRFSIASFLDAMNITLYIAGGMLIAYGLSRDLDILFIVLAGISILTFLLSKGFILPFLSVILFVISLIGEVIHLSSSWKLLEVGVILILGTFLLTNVYETRVSLFFKKHIAKYRPFHAGLFVCCIVLLAVLSIRSWIIDTDFFWISSIAIWIGIFIITRQIMKVMEVQSTTKQVGVYAICLIICLPTLFAPYLSGSLFLILICFHYGYRAECATSLLLFIYAISKYYYDLSQSLLVKSITLFFTGIALLIAWHYFTQKRTKHEKI
ncbi:DUF4401 domain-containing protein [Bacteroides sp.]|uniref:DUF4401 domain-containing protein n=1 Tax=Bacteroides sp. TaxID=29523 RepID=UPI0026039EF3|nr:DUF4401 domain-containing protein [Bacteroides sp.]MDD3039875.1 DUF4401 domain-containing protein [Bacteroides sp.]